MMNREALEHYKEYQTREQILYKADREPTLRLSGTTRLYITTEKVLGREQIRWTVTEDLTQGQRRVYPTPGNAGPV